MPRTPPMVASIAVFDDAMKIAEQHRTTLRKNFGLTDRQIGFLVTARRRQPANGYRQHDPQATGQLFSEIASAFQEDKRVVEAQQARLEETGEGGLVDILTDKARVHMRRVVERRIAEGTQRSAAE